MLLIAILRLTAIAAATFYVLYHTHRPAFSVTSLKISQFNLTTTTSDGTTRLTTKPYSTRQKPPTKRQGQIEFIEVRSEEEKLDPITDRDGHDDRGENRKVENGNGCRRGRGGGGGGDGGRMPPSLGQRQRFETSDLTTVTVRYVGVGNV
ncbi:unnamed protein product [Fraxinus pennsylvanica]|uniref:Uncharacterized protein n=1 Tax=Fraxinus pennsylvanica TaxID=56036 RepID=A0AAD1ZMF2_9LAMI|nr:unnamed protein product [Fraxinus pennsylvanica]